MDDEYNDNNEKNLKLSKDKNVKNEKKTDEIIEILTEFLLLKKEAFFSSRGDKTKKNQIKNDDFN